MGGDVTTTNKSRVLIVPVAADCGWPEYKELSMYRCLPNRSFRPSDYIAFYANGEIQPLVPKIKSVIEAIQLDRREEFASLDGYQKKLAEELREKSNFLPQHSWFLSTLWKFMFLTGPGDNETVKLPGPIANDKKDKNGNPAPFTYGKARYVTLESLQKARKTSELERC
jgi:hypothetical protein